MLTQKSKATNYFLPEIKTRHFGVFVELLYPPTLGAQKRLDSSITLLDLLASKFKVSSQPWGVESEKEGIGAAARVAAVVVAAAVAAVAPLALAWR